MTAAKMDKESENTERTALSIARERIRNIFDWETISGQEQLCDIYSIQKGSATTRKMVKNGNLAHQFSLMKERVDHLYRVLDSKSVAEIDRYFQFLGRMKNGHFLISSIGSREKVSACSGHLIHFDLAHDSPSPFTRKVVTHASEKPKKKTRRSRKKGRSEEAKVRRARLRMERYFGKEGTRSEISTPFSHSADRPSLFASHGTSVACSTENARNMKFSRMRSHGDGVFSLENAASAIN